MRGYWNWNEGKNAHFPCWLCTIWWILSNLMIGRYFFSFWFKTLEFSKWSISLWRPCNLAYFSMHIYLTNIYFLTFVFFPHIFFKFLVKFNKMISMDEVNEPISNIALILRYLENITEKSQGRYKKS